MDERLDLGLLTVGQVEFLLDVRLSEGRCAALLVGDLLETVDLLRFEERRGLLQRGRVHAAIQLLHLLEALFALEILDGLEVLAHLLAGLLGELLGLLDLLVIQLQLLLDAGVLQQEGGVAAEAAESPSLGGGGADEQGDQTQTQQASKDHLLHRDKLLNADREVTFASKSRGSIASEMADRVGRGERKARTRSRNPNPRPRDRR